MLLVGIILGLLGWINQDYLKEQINWYTTMRPYRVANVDPYVLSADAERALKPGQSFRECAKNCPEMVVIPAGELILGPMDNNRDYKITIAKLFVVSKFDVTFHDWDTCVSVGGCPQVSDGGYGRGEQPVINVSWVEAQRYVTWLSKMTGRLYRLLTETEWEYAARAGTTTEYFWGNEVFDGRANCHGCGGSEWEDRQPSPVGSFPPNDFGLYDMAGNVWQWVQDCDHGHWETPADGTAWTTGDCSHRVVRGGSWLVIPELVASNSRSKLSADDRLGDLGFRVRPDP